ncbi:MAG: glycosyl transferase group 1 family protein [Ramlibacter sp.]|jgi:glycosyltransferase involved in cell wall biosynthesis|nr:glycosyl transferase group 1 family protein [Ramlibacter sp.]
MKVVLVSSFPAFPTSAGNRSRIRQLAAAVRELGHELTFVYLESPWEACDDTAHEASFGSFVRIPRKHWRLKWARDVLVGGVKRVLRLAGVDAAHYSRLDRFRDRGFLAALRALQLRPDAVIVEYVLDSWAFAAFPASARRVLDTHDAFGDRHRTYVERGIRDYWISLRPGSENAGLRRAHVVLAIQEEEARRFREQLAGDGAADNPEVAVVGHLLALGEVRANHSIDHVAVFIASDNPANRHAADGLLRDILPRVLREMPAFELRLAGSICRAVPDTPNVTKLGWVEDLAAVFARAPLSVNPMQAGTGINIKLLESMAAGVPTVSTATGARGLPESALAGVFVVPDHDPQAFAQAVIRFASDAALRRQTGQAAREQAARLNARQLAQLDRALGGN